MISIIRADIKYRQLYVCSICNKKEQGSCVEYTTYSTGMLKDLLDKQPLKANNMPIGWCNSYSKGYVCPTCK